MLRYPGLWCPTTAIPSGCCLQQLITWLEPNVCGRALRYCGGTQNLDSEGLQKLEVSGMQMWRFEMPGALAFSGAAVEEAWELR